MAIYTLPEQYSTDFQNPRVKPVGDVEINKYSPDGCLVLLSDLISSDIPVGVDNSISTLSLKVGSAGEGGLFLGGTTERREHSLSSNYASGSFIRQDLTLCCTFEFPTSIGSCYIYNAGARFNIAIGKEGISSGKIGFSYFSGAVFRVASFSEVPELGVIYTVIIGKKEGSSARAYLFKNYVLLQVITVASTNNIVYDAARQVTIAARGSWAESSNSVDLLVYDYFILSRDVGDARCKVIGTSPYQRLKPKDPALYHTTAITGGGDLLLTNRSIANFTGMRQ